MLIPSRAATRRNRHKTRGQSLVELALVLPVLLLLTMSAIDFGRLFLGWINLQQMTRVAAGYASEHASAWGTPGDPAERNRYQTMVTNDARAINCELPDPLPDPVIPSGTALGAPVTVGLSCEFSLITPIISNILGETVLVSAENTFPIREGAVAAVPGGGNPIVPPPVTAFVGTPQSGWAPLEVTFVDLSVGAPTAWTWDFSEGTPGGTGTGAPDTATALSEGPHTVTYDCTGTPGDTCVFSVSLESRNAGGADTVIESDYITVTVPPATGPIADFTATPSTGEEPLNVDFDFVDVRGGAVIYTNYEWDFDNDGTFDDTGISASHTYTSPGSHEVTLRVTDDANATASVTKIAVVVAEAICVVPDFANVKVNDAQDRWEDAGFTTTVNITRPPNGNYDIGNQTLTGGTIDPQPLGCDSIITVSE